MSALIRHTVSEPKKPLWQNLVYVVVIVLVVNLSVEWTNNLPKGVSGIVSIGILVVAAMYSYYLINRKLAQYTYILIDEDLIFYKEIGKKENKILEVKLYDIEWIKPVQEIPKGVKCHRVYSLACKLKGQDVYVGQFSKNSKKYRFVFQPNEGLLKAIGK